LVSHSEGIKLIEVVGNKVQKNTFRPKRDELTYYWRIIRKEELVKLYSSSNSARTIK
jgi:hypothetical protein